MIKRIIIAHDYIEGSASSNRILGFAKGYYENGIEVYLMLFSPQKAVSLDLKGITVRVFHEPRVKLKIVRRLLAIHKYVKAIKELYIPGITAIHIFSAPWWGFLFNKKKYYFFFEKGEIPFYSESRSLLYRIQEWMGLKVVPKATGLLAQTFSLKEYYSNHGVKNIEVINMFVDTGRFKDIVPDKREKYIAYCGTISKQKDGIDVLIKAFYRVHKEHGDYKLLLIGGFEKLYDDESSILDLVSSLELSDCVVFTGRVKSVDIPPLLKNAGILTMARPVNKQTQYGFPTKLGEYLCTGNPIVLTCVGEVGMYLTDRVNCVFVKSGDVEDLAEKLCWVITHKKEAEQIGMAGKKLVDTFFDIHSQTKKAIDFFTSVMKC